MSARPTAAQDEITRARTTILTALDALWVGLLADSGTLEPTAKADGTPVTAADLEVERRLGERLADVFPAHGLISEERLTRAPDTEWTWILDPIDGTSNFTARLPYWCVSVALALEGTPVLAVIDAPVLGRRYLAVAGAGAEVESRTTALDGTTQALRRRPLRVRAAVDWRDPRNRHVPFMMTPGTARRARAAGVRLNPRVMGSTALDLAVVAEGVAVGSIAMIPRIWDVAAGGLLVREAGGALVTLGDTPLLPVVAGTDQRQRTAPTAAGPDERYVREVTAGLLAD